MKVKVLYKMNITCTERSWCVNAESISSIELGLERNKKLMFKQLRLRRMAYAHELDPHCLEMAHDA